MALRARTSAALCSGASEERAEDEVITAPEEGHTGSLGPRGGQEGCGAPGAGGAARAQVSGCSGAWREEGAVEGLTAPERLGTDRWEGPGSRSRGLQQERLEGGGRWRLGPA